MPEMKAHVAAKRVEKCMLSGLTVGLFTCCSGDQCCWSVEISLSRTKDKAINIYTTLPPSAKSKESNSKSRYTVKHLGRLLPSS